VWQSIALQGDDWMFKQSDFADLGNSSAWMQPWLYEVKRSCTSKTMLTAKI
jgi:hypothetical protein